jgi:hypothetical protein
VANAARSTIRVRHAHENLVCTGVGPHEHAFATRINFDEVRFESGALFFFFCELDMAEKNDWRTTADFSDRFAGAADRI